MKKMVVGLIVKLLVIVLFTIIAITGFNVVENTILRPTTNSLVEDQLSNSNAAVPTMDAYFTMLTIFKVVLFGALFITAIMFIYKFFKDNNILE